MVGNRADRAFVLRTGTIGMYPLMYWTHNIHFVSYARAQQGRYDDAKKAAEEMVVNVRDGVDHMQMLEGHLADTLREKAVEDARVVLRDQVLLDRAARITEDKIAACVASPVRDTKVPEGVARVSSPTAPADGNPFSATGEVPLCLILPGPSPGASPWAAPPSCCWGGDYDPSRNQ